MVEVPTPEQVALRSKRPEEYRVLGRDDEPSEGGVGSHFPVECPVCFTRMYAAPDEVGQEMTCPDCGTAVVAIPLPEAPLKGQPRGPLVTEEYAVLEDSDHWSETASLGRIAFFPVYCSVCGTLMHATEDQVGQSLLCPDCNSAVVVPPPDKDKDRPLPAHPVDDEYALRDDGRQPDPGSAAAEEVLIPVECPVCRGKTNATEAEVGRHVLCPDCFTPVAVPEPNVEPAKAETAPESFGEYALGQVEERPAYQPEVIVDVGGLRPVEKSRRKRSGAGRARRGPSPWPFFAVLMGFLVFVVYAFYAAGLRGFLFATAMWLVIMVVYFVLTALAARRDKREWHDVVDEDEDDRRAAGGELEDEEAGRQIGPEPKAPGPPGDAAVRRTIAPTAPSGAPPKADPLPEGPPKPPAKSILDDDFDLP